MITYPTKNRIPSVLQTICRSTDMAFSTSEASSLKKCVTSSLRTSACFWLFVFSSPNYIEHGTLNENSFEIYYNMKVLTSFQFKTKYRPDRNFCKGRAGKSVFIWRWEIEIKCHEAMICFNVHDKESSDCF